MDIKTQRDASRGRKSKATPDLSHWGGLEKNAPLVSFFCQEKNTLGVLYLKINKPSFKRERAETAAFDSHST